MSVVRSAVRALGVIAAALLLAACADKTIVQAPPASQGGHAEAAPKSAPVPLPPPPPPGTGLAEPGSGVPTHPAEPAEQPPPTQIVAGSVRVAILLPLSGRDAALGRAMLDAAEMAVFDFGDENFTLLPYDTEAAGAGAVAQKAIDAGAELILGPLYARQVHEVADVARGRGVNLITFSNDSGVAGPGIFVFGLPPGETIEAVVRYAHDKGAATYAALLPDDAYGQRLSAALQRTVEADGDTMVRNDTYPAGTSDFTTIVRRTAEFDQRQAHEKVEENAGRTNDQRRRAAKLETDKDVDYQALVVGESGQRLKNMAALLPYYDIDVPRIHLLGPNTWEDATLGTEPGLVGAWFAAPDPAQRQAYEQHYRGTYGHAAPRLTTLSYDATGLAAVLARLNGHADFSGDALRNPVGFAGVDGIFRFNEAGVVERGLAIMEIQPRSVVTIQPAPTSFDVPSE
jgi:outer membrane PBP1 activator LpoA protein